MLGTDDDPIAARVAQAVAALEQIQGRRAGRTRPMVEKRGPVEAIKRWLRYPAPSQGYEKLVAAGLWQLTAEAIPLDYPDAFTAAELAVARYRIADARQGFVSDPFFPR